MFVVVASARLAGVSSTGCAGTLAQCWMWHFPRSWPTRGGHCGKPRQETWLCDAPCMAVFLMLVLSQVLPAQRLLQEKFASYRHRQLFETGRQRRCARRCCTPCKLYSSLMLVLFQSAQAQDEGGRGARRAGVDFWFSVAFQYRLCSPTVVTPMLAATRSLRIVRIYHHI